MAERTIAHALFTHTVDGRSQMALRGETVELSEEDIERGERFGAFVDDPDDLEHFGKLPTFEYDADDVADIEAWLRSASPADVSAAVEAAARQGVDVTGLMLAGEVGRGTEARRQVVQLLEAASVLATAPPREVAGEGGLTPAADARSGLTPEPITEGEQTPGDHAAERADQPLEGTSAGTDQPLEGTQAGAPSRGPEGAQDAVTSPDSVQGTREPLLPSTVHQGAPGDGGTTKPESDRIDDILTWVGADKERAQIALDAERADKGDRARPRLVGALTEIANSS